MMQKFAKGIPITELKIIGNTEKQEQTYSLNQMKKFLKNLNLIMKH